MRHDATGGPTTGTLRLLRLGLRTGGGRLLLIAVIGSALVLATAVSIEALYADLPAREQYAATLGASPASLAFNGRAYGLTTTGGIMAFEVGFIGQLLFPLLAMHVALHHTRREEEAGRTELLTATRVGRLAPLTAGASLLALTCLATGTLTLLGVVAFTGLPATGTAWYAAGMTMLMVFSGAVALLLGQLAQSTRTAQLAGLGALTAAFAVRALVDGTGADAVWASPLGWLAEVRPFAEPQVWPLLAYAGASLVLGVLAVLVARSRDLGAGLLAPRAGPSRGHRSLGTAAGAAWRLTRGTALTWVLLAVAWAACFGALTREMADLVDANPALLEALGVERGSDVVTSLAVVVVCLAATAVAVHGAGRWGDEESSGRLGAMLATRVSRTRLWLAWWAVVVTTSVAVLALGCLTLGLSAWAVTQDRANLATALEVGTGYAVPVLFVAAVAALLRAAVPRVATVAWLLVAWVVLVGFLAEVLRIPDWARNLSPLHLVGTLPQDEASGSAVLGLGVGAVAVLGASLVAVRRRDLRVG